MRLPLSLRLRLLFRREHPQAAAAAEHVSIARARAAALMDRVHGRFFAECFADIEMATFFGEEGDKLLISFELQFLWGFFHEVVAEVTLPTNGYDRIKLHLIDWLVSARGYEISAAVREANVIEGLFNEDEPIFGSISGLGRRSHTVPQEDALLIVVRALMKTNARI